MSVSALAVLARWRRGSRRLLPSQFVSGILLLGWAAQAASQIETNQIELAASADVRQTSGVTDAQINLLAGWFWRVPFSVEMRFGFERQRQANVFDYSLHLLWQWQPRRPNVLFVQLGAGGESETVGSFGQSKFVAAGGIGMRSFLAPRIALRSEYVFRRLSGKTFGYNEHALLVGIAVFLN